MPTKNEIREFFGMFAAIVVTCAAYVALMWFRTTFLWGI